ETCAAASHFGGVYICIGTQQRRRRACVADAHFARDEQIAVSLYRKLLAGFDRLERLLARHRGLLREIARAGRDFPVDHSLDRAAENTDVDDMRIDARFAAQDVD